MLAHKNNSIAQSRITRPGSLEIFPIRCCTRLHSPSPLNKNKNTFVTKKERPVKKETVLPKSSKMYALLAKTRCAEHVRHLCFVVAVFGAYFAESFNYSVSDVGCKFCSRALSQGKGQHVDINNNCKHIQTPVLKRGVGQVPASCAVRGHSAVSSW